MKILVITSCTGKKASKPENQLTLSDFQQGPEHLKRREQELSEYFLPAEKLYTGGQHIRLMHGVEALRRTDIEVELWIVSAGYGLIPGERELPPYETTFTGMGKKLGAHAEFLNISTDFRQCVQKPYDMGPALLRYLNIL